MKKGFYPRMAWDSIRKNKRLYVPYILTCIGMVMMYYIIFFLSENEFIAGLKGGSAVTSMLGMGADITGVFAAVFLFYTNSFLIRRRKKEFGLYNILGMGKGNLARILLWESIQIAVCALTLGVCFGVALSKLAELVIIRVMRGEAVYRFLVDPRAMQRTVLWFGGVFLLLFLNMLRQVHFSRPIELLRSENVGERPPKGNRFIALLGVLILGAAYYISVKIQDPVAAVVWFFLAVFMVIVATYLLFIAGSVTLCRLLQKNKKYYYKTNHFVSVSSMKYRMKRNGAGLASICILCTMVLVMLSATICLYAGEEGVLRNRYPRNINLTLSYETMTDLNEENRNLIYDLVEEIIEEEGAEKENVQDYTAALAACVIKEGRMDFDDDSLNSFGMDSYNECYQLFIMDIADYNRMMGENVELAGDEAYLYVSKGSCDWDELSVGGVNRTYKIKGTAEKFIANGIDTMQIIPSLFLFVEDMGELAEELLTLADDKGEGIVRLSWFYGFDVAAPDEVQITVNSRIAQKLREYDINGAGGFYGCSAESVAAERSDFYGIFGGLLALAILLAVIFVFAAVLIIYYKQVSEGYEDCERFEIMQKVGMTKQEIKKSINSQVLTVFFAPLLMACVHLCFAFPIVQKLLLAFGFTDTRLFFIVNVVCVLVFGVFYTIVYQITSGAYYGIVSDGS